MDDESIIDLFWRRDQAAIAETDRKYGRRCGIEGVPMFIELGGFCPPGHAYSALVIGTNHIVG